MGEGHERDAAASALERVLASATFQGAARSRALLKFLVEETLAGRAARLKEYTLGAEALEKGDAFDPRTDPIVRAEASRLRTRLDRYYETEGGLDPLVIALPKGTYVPVFRRRETGAPRTSGRHARRWLEGSAAILVLAAFIATAGRRVGTAEGRLTGADGRLM